MKLKITNASFISSDKRARVSGGLYVNFKSSENLVKGQNLKISFEGKSHYFEVSDISISGDDLEIKAREVGYWATKFDRNKDFDLRKLIGIDIEIINDKEIISKIHEMSCWC